MNTNKPILCHRCKAPIPAASTDRICPACFMSGALEPHKQSSTLSAEATIAIESPHHSETPVFPHAFGHYQLLGLLGRGGMGAVYDAKHKKTGRRVALKKLEHQLDPSDMKQRFLREGRLAASVRHPNSLYVFGSEEVEGIPVITMEIADSGTLKDKLKKEGPLPVEKAIDAILDIIAGLETAAKGGVLHRDIKPSNCFVSPDGTVKVGDYGLSVSTLGNEDSYLTATGAVMGTPAYASPEQLRGDALDIRSDIYSVGATLFTLLTGQAPIDGKNAVQVVANAVNQKPKSVSKLREEVPPILSQVVSRCLAKDPNERYPDYTTLRESLLPFSSREPEPASLKMRMAAGWIDFLSAFLVPYLALMFSISVVEFHFQPFIERTLYSARYYFAFLSFGFLYFSLTEGIWGAGLGKWLFGLRVVRLNDRAPGLCRSFIRILIPILSCEIFRVVFLLKTLSVSNLHQISVTDNLLLIGASNVCPFIAVLLTLRASPKNGFATAWDYLSGTRVVRMPKAVIRPSMQKDSRTEATKKDTEFLGPYQIECELVPGKWVTATDPVLRRQVRLIRRGSNLSEERRQVARPGRLRWLQEVIQDQNTWDAFESPEGVSLSGLIKKNKTIPWNILRHWLHDLASELWEASRDKTLPRELSFDHVRITPQAAILLDERDLEIEASACSFPSDHLEGQQQFMSAVASCVDPTSIPLHARPVLQNLEQGKFEKLSYLAGTLCGLLDKPAVLGKGVRAMSIFMLPLYIGIMVFVGMFNEESIAKGGLLSAIRIILGILGSAAIIQFLALPLRWIWSHDVFGFVVIDAQGKRASTTRRFIRWMIVWFPLSVPIGILWTLMPQNNPSTIMITIGLLFAWMSGAFYTVMHPNRGLHDRLAGTWVVRR
ncbi:protein kinase [Verrucomicrobia bacterium]|nr:protein kinase [Verrucomicrobiota bacterium]